MFFEKVECLASTYKSGSLRGKLPKKTVYIREFISYFFFFFEREFQPMASASDDSFLSPDQDTNQFLV